MSPGSLAYLMVQEIITLVSGSGEALLNMLTGSSPSERFEDELNLQSEPEHS